MPAGLRHRQLRQSLEYLLEVETPFRRDHVYWGFRLGSRHRGGTRSVDLVVVPKSVVDPHMAMLRQNGIHPREISYRGDLALDGPICLARYPERSERRGGRLLAILGVAIVVQLAAIAVVPIYAQAIRTADITEETARLSRIAAELGGMRGILEKKMEPIREAQLDLQGLPSAAAVVRLMEAELGSDTVLDRFSLRGTNVQATGSTPNVDLLTARLEKSKALKPKSITRNGAAVPGKPELFSISLELTSAKDQ